MNIIGIEIKKPSLRDAALVLTMGVIVWVVVISTGITDKTSVSAGALLVAILWGCTSSIIGISPVKGSKHFFLQIGGCLVAMAIYEVVASLF